MGDRDVNLPAAEEIPDLDVGDAPQPKRAEGAAPMSVMDMDDFGVEGERVNLALDLADGESPSKGQVSSPDITEQPEPRAEVSPEPPPEPQATSEDAKRVAAELQAGLVAFFEALWDDDAPVGLKVLPGGLLVGLALIVTVIDQIYSATSDEVLEIGPLRAGWIAGPLLVAGIVLILYRLIPRGR